MRKALRSVGNTWVPLAQSKAPDDSGGLRDSIRARVSTKNEGQEGSVTVGPTFMPRKDGKKSVGPGVYGMFVEFGLKKKEYPSTPFLRPTFDTSGMTVVDVFAEVLKEELANIDV
jgi:HK97 gp10 family phage protein